MDIDKVIKGLECHGKGGSKGCRGCPYELTSGCQLILCHDAIALLNEQEEQYKKLLYEIDELMEERNELRKNRMDSYYSGNDGNLIL